MGTKQKPGSFDFYDRALPDEPMFTLLARDASAPGQVRQWAYERSREIVRGERPVSDCKAVDEAREVADEMERWRQANEGAWRRPLVA